MDGRSETADRARGELPASGPDASRSGRPRPPTSSDVAKRAGVSRTAVSFVLNDRPHAGISQATRQRVLRAAAELGYHPNRAARSLASGRTGQIGVLVSESRQDAFGDAFLPALLRGIGAAARERSYQVLLEYQEAAIGRRVLAALEERAVDGLLIWGPDTLEPDLIDATRARSPVMVIGDPGSAPYASVDVDNQAAARLATEHLLGHGYRRIALITNAPLSYPSAQARLRGYCQALTAAGLSRPDRWIIEGRLDEASGRRAAEELLRRSPLPEAIFAASDQVAIGVLRALSHQSLSVPGDIAVLGFDDLPGAGNTNPPLSTIRVPAADLGRTACHRLIDLIGGGEVTPLRVTLPSPLVPRHSCGEHQGPDEQG